MDVFEASKERSIRSFTTDDVSDGTVKQLIAAAYDEIVHYETF